MVFVRNLETQKAQLAQQSYAHLEQVLSEDFVSLLQAYGAKIASNELE